jgi:hypothetical protein
MKQPRRGLQGNPLDAVIPDLRVKMGQGSRTSAPAVGSQPGENGGGSPQGTPSPRRLRRRFTAHVRDDVIERAKNAVYWTPGLTMADVVERGMERILDELEKKHGGPFVARSEENRGGRPIL